MVHVTIDTPPGTRVMNMALLRHATLIQPQDSVALIVYDRKPTVVDTAPCAVLTILSDQAQPPTHPSRSTEVADTDAFPATTQARENVWYNLGVLQGTVRVLRSSLLAFSRSIDITAGAAEWYRVPAMFQTIEDCVTNLKPLPTWDGTGDLLADLHSLATPRTTDTPEEN